MPNQKYVTFFGQRFPVDDPVKMTFKGIELVKLVELGVIWGEEKPKGLAADIDKILSEE